MAKCSKEDGVGVQFFVPNKVPQVENCTFGYETKDVHGGLFGAYEGQSILYVQE
jgi:hypothetical protein